MVTTISSKRGPSRSLTIIAQDPGVKIRGKILRVEVDVPVERLQPGPAGHRVSVVDYDGSRNVLRAPYRLPARRDRFAAADDEELIASPRFHAQNIYAIVMRTVARFELALGRRAGWGFPGHRIRLVPHAFAEPNAFYSPAERAIVFGYFPGRKAPVYTCLSHDIVAHEAAHALLHGLRRRYMDPSSPDQAAFHEGFADIVALLSVFSLPGVVAAVLGPSRLRKGDLAAAELRRSLLFGLAKQLGEELSQFRGEPLRRSVELAPSPEWLTHADFASGHRRGEILVAAVMNAFLTMWLARLEGLGRRTLDRERVAEEGAATASYLLTAAIRALDYAPPTGLEFRDYLSAILTADHEMPAPGSGAAFRAALLESFASYGIRPAAPSSEGVWTPPPETLSYAHCHFESLRRDPDEVFRFLWENRDALGLNPEADTVVQSVRPSARIGADGFVLHETVAEYVQQQRLTAAELKKLRIRVPDGMGRSAPLTLYGGGVLIFDEFGRLKHHVHNHLNNAERQSARLEYLWREGRQQSFAEIHRKRRIAA